MTGLCVERSYLHERRHFRKSYHFTNTKVSLIHNMKWGLKPQVYVKVLHNMESKDV